MDGLEGIEPPTSSFVAKHSNPTELQAGNGGEQVHSKPKLLNR